MKKVGVNYLINFYHENKVIFTFIFIFVCFPANSTQNLDYNNECEQGCMDEANDTVEYDNCERSLYNEPAMNDVEEGCV